MLFKTQNFLHHSRADILYWEISARISLFYCRLFIHEEWQKFSNEKRLQIVTHIAEKSSTEMAANFIILTRVNGGKKKKWLVKM
jgi:hypothetical protein